MYYIRENKDIERCSKKKYCHCCGKELETRWIEKPVKERYIEIFGERYYYISAFGKWCFYDDKIVLLTNEYHCSDCGRSFSVDEQRDIIQAQKELNKNILSEREISQYKENSLEESIEKIKKIKWLSWIPCLGGIILYSKAFSYPLIQKSLKNDGRNILFASLTTVLLALIVCALLFSFISTDIIQYDITLATKRIVSVLISLWSFNLPILWYIKYKLLQ